MDEEEEANANRQKNARDILNSKRIRAFGPFTDTILTSISSAPKKQQRATTKKPSKKSLLGRAY